MIWLTLPYGVKQKQMMPKVKEKKIQYIDQKKFVFKVPPFERPPGREGVGG